MNQLLMGVINITPNSFSDGGQFNQQLNFEEHFKNQLSTVDIIDIGTESTAPFNEPISFEEELRRYEAVFFPFLKKEPDPGITLSIDTYKINVFKSLIFEINKYWPKTNVIFNDVSGCLDEDLMDLFLDESIDFSYIYSHNLVPTREETSHHMDFCLTCNNEVFIRELKNYFKNGLEKLKGIKKEIIIDPCFGFSKTREQNQYLLSHMGDFLNEIDVKIPLLYGISRKSFLRFPADLDVKDPTNKLVLDNMQTLLMSELLKNNPDREIIFRCHNNTSLKAIQNVQNIFDLNS